jgi:hypothetical protein
MYLGGTRGGRGSSAAFGIDRRLNGFTAQFDHFTRRAGEAAGAGGGNENPEHSCRPNGLEVNPRGQGPRAEARAARRLPAFEGRDAGGVTPRKLR